MSQLNEDFLDQNSGAPLDPRILEALSRFLPFRLPEHSGGLLLGNPSSNHLYGRNSRRILSQARESILQSLGTAPGQGKIVFTSSGTESNQAAIRGILERRLREKKKRIRWVTTPVEHRCVLDIIPWAESQGVEVALLEVDSNGLPTLASIEAQITEATDLLSVIWVNNETGVIAAVEGIISMAKVQAPNLIVQVDAAQAWGKIPVALNTLGADLVSFSGAKVGALQGSGFFWMKKAMAMDPLIIGHQEGGYRGGAENLISAFALGEAAKNLSPQAWTEKVRPIQAQFEKALIERIPTARIIAQDAPRVANTTYFTVRGVMSSLIPALDIEGKAVSAGSACSSGSENPSHVLIALGIDRDEARSAIRVSLSSEHTLADTDRFIDALERVLKQVSSVG